MTKKPTATLEVVARIDSVGAITSNMNDVQQQALQIKEFYSNLIITEDDVPEMKKEKAQINKMKDDVATYRKNIIAEFKKPIEEFESTAKATEKILKEAYDCVNDQIAAYEAEVKKKTEDELRAYFDEKKDTLHIDFVKFEDAKISIPLNPSKKKLMEAVNKFFEEITGHLRAIACYPEDQQPEILVEYKETLNFTNSVINAQKRIKAREEEKARQEALKELKAQEEKAAEKVESIVINSNEEVTVPIEVKEEPKIYKATFTVRGTVDQLRNLKAFMEKEGISYDTSK